MGSGDPTDQNIELVEKVYPELSREALADRFGCFGVILRCVIFFVALAVPAKIALAVMGDSLSWGREFLAILVFCAVSSSLFTVAAILVNPHREAAPVPSEPPEPPGLDDYLFADQRLRRLSREARIVFVYSGGTDEMRDFLVRHLPFRFRPQELQTILRGHFDLAYGRIGARDLASAGLITLNGDSVTFTDEGVELFADAWKALKEHRDKPGNAPAESL